MKRIAAALALALAGCASSPVAAPRLACSAPEGTEALLDRRERYLVFGEMHGTAEAPAVFGEIVCAAARRGPVIVGIEWPPELAGDFNAYLHAGGDGARAAFRTVMERNSGFDGRSSAAALALFDRLRELSLAGGDLRIVPFAGAGPPYDPATPITEQHDRNYADPLLAETQGAQGRVLVLVGNAHAMREPMQFSTLRVIPMASLLPEGDTLSLDIAHAGGTFWGCIRMRCKAYDNAAAPGAAGVVVFPERRNRYDGTWNVGRITASPPAFGIVLPPGSPFTVG